PDRVRGGARRGNRRAEDQPAGPDHLGLLRRRRIGAHGPRPPRHHGRQVEVPPRQRGVHGSGEDLRRSGRSTLTSSSFFPNLFPFPSNPPEREHPSSSLSIRRLPFGRRAALPTGGG